MAQHLSPNVHDIAHLTCDTAMLSMSYTYLHRNAYHKSKDVMRVADISDKINGQTVTLASLFTDVLLSVLKISVGLAADSRVLVSDGIHSCSDIISSAVVTLGVALGNTKSEKGRFIKRLNKLIPPEKAELFSLTALSLFLFATGICLSLSGTVNIIRHRYSSTVPPSYALLASAFSLLFKEILFVCTFIVSKKENSVILYANAWHHQSDALSCLCSFTGILFSRLGLAFFDPLASAIIGCAVIKFGFSSAGSAVRAYRKTKTKKADENSPA